MLFSLTNLKRRTFRDPDDELLVMPKLLHGRSAIKLLEQAIALFEGYVGRPRSAYDSRSLEGVLGDYRLGRCIESCLLTRYSFVPPPLEVFLTPEQVAWLTERGLDSPTALRLALWDAANALHGGAVPPAERVAFLGDFAQQCGLPPEPDLIDSLTARDSEAAAILTRTGDTPAPRELMGLYNRGAVQTLLAHSTRIEFRVSQLPGHALKRLYFVAKRRGVYVEIEAVEGGGYSLVLYGPEQAAGTADKYGRRLAEVTLSLLRSLLQEDETEAPSVAATAYLIMHDKEYRFHITREILGRLEYGPDRVDSAGSGRVAENVATYSVGSSVDADDDVASEEPSFDSMVEARLYREFKSLERQGHTHGWLLQREPDPLLAPGVVLIPDFAFLRGDTRVFMEIAGFWSPGYREKKVAKLRALSASDGTTPLILAMPHEATASFTGLPFPIVPYKTAVRATDMLTLLDTHYGQREARQDAAQGQIESLQVAASERGFIPEREIAESLQAYTRTELLTSARMLDSDECIYVAGVGLFSKSRLEELRDTIETLLQARGGKIELDDVSLVVARSLSIPQLDIEALLTMWSDWRIERPSLFEAYLVCG
jgi:predicted nuclease of restriction endonuclease-like RecB superfamily